PPLTVEAKYQKEIPLPSANNDPPRGAPKVLPANAIDNPNSPAASPQPQGGGGGERSTDEGLLAFIFSGIFWGAVSLLTPCVFPMIPITVSFFIKQSEKEHHRPLAMAIVYSATIVIVLTIGA